MWICCPPPAHAMGERTPDTTIFKGIDTCPYIIYKVKNVADVKGMGKRSIEMYK
jgi:hypothetical protein